VGTDLFTILGVAQNTTKNQIRGRRWIMCWLCKLTLKRYWYEDDRL